MLPNDKSNPEMAIGHVLALDVVGYSKLLIHEQSELLQRLNEIVRGTNTFRTTAAKEELTRLPTGDGMVLVFFADPQAPIECAMEIATALTSHPDIHLRMGVHSGPINEFLDVNERKNVAGAGIDIAQRVMDCGDAGHILLSKRVAEDLAPYAKWNPHLHELGECEAKHGRKISLVNFFTDEIGNPEVPEKYRPSAPRAVPQTTPRSGAIAVLPLENVSGESSEEYVADGMTEALITDLSKIGGLKVISRGSVMGFKGTKQPLAEIGRVLGVEFIVEGSILRARDRIRISTRLVRAATDEYLWAERYDRELADVLALQDEVARAVAHAIGETLHRTVATIAPRRVDPEVYLLDLRGRHYWHERTEMSFRAALQLFEEASARDPTYAPAYIGIAESLNMLANYGLVPPQEIRPRSLAAAQRALALGNSSGDAHRLLAFIRWQFEFDWNAAIAAYERALELDPHSPTTTYWFGTCLGVIGFFDRSHQLLDRAQELDPLSLVVPSVQGWTRFFERRFEEALPYYEQVLRIDPNFHLALWFRGEALTELERYDEGISSLERAYELGGQTSRLLGYLGYAYGRAGRKDDARKSLAELKARAQQQSYVPPYFPALVLSGLGENERALDRLEQSYGERDTMLRDLKADAHWDRMRALPRFKALMQKMAYPNQAKRARA